MNQKIPIYRAKSNEIKNSYVEGLLIGLDEENGSIRIQQTITYNKATLLKGVVTHNKLTIQTHKINNK